MEIQRATLFKKDFRKLSDELKERTNGKILILISNPKHPSLRLKRVRSEKDVWEARITRSYRFTFQRVEKGVILLRRIGKHDEVLKNP